MTQSASNGLALSINRTFMELKQIRLVVSIWREKVLIEPLWNWNTRAITPIVNNRGVLIEPLWNWNCDEGAKGRGRTGINRTFMELKHAKKHYPWCDAIVLIEPLWNWNSDVCHDRKRYECINRTFMELKPLNTNMVKMVTLVLIEPLWNWNRRFSA